jgi:hypothetical protein
MDMYSRFSKLPSRFTEDYELMLVVMTVLGSEIRRGDGINGNCHSIARALAKIFIDFRVVDGYIYSLAPHTCDEGHGAKALLVNEVEKKVECVRFKRLYHSWLMWRDTNLIIDPWPVGGAYGFSPPVARIQDGFDIFHVEGSFPDMFVESRLNEDIQHCDERLKKILDGLPSEFKKAA